MPTITFRSGDEVNIILPAGSGIFDTFGYYGSGGFGFSVKVGEYQDNSFVTNENGTAVSGALPNLKFSSSSGAFVANESSATSLKAAGSGAIQLAEAPLEIELDSSDIGPTSWQNMEFRAADPASINLDPSGVTVQAFELKSDPSGNSNKTGFNTDGDSTWTDIHGSGVKLSIDDQLWPSGTHKIWIGLSAKPNSIGAKKFIKYFAGEFLILPILVALSFLTII